jgi:hypothetical protein
MTKKNFLLVLAAIGLATVYVIWFTDWFRPKTVHIFHINRNLRPYLARGNALPNLIFGVRPQVQFTELKVVLLTEFQTNKDAIPVWHLISDSNSMPMKSFYYGEHIEGMHSKIKGVRAEALETNVTYRMFITAGNIKGQHDFELQ